MPALTAEIATLESDLADPALYSADPARFDQLSKRLTAAQEELETAEMDWLELEEKREGLESTKA